MMKKFDFLLGTWDLEYRIPKSSLGEKGSGQGTGTFKRALRDKYVVFDYTASDATGNRTGAHAIFVWDEKSKIHRYWWFEDSGSFMTASCHFPDDQTLYLYWHESPFFQTFKKTGPDQVTLWMGRAAAGDRLEKVLEVLMTKKTPPRRKTGR